MPVDPKSLVKLLAKDPRSVVGFDVWYPDRELPVRYQSSGQINFQAARKVTVVFGTGNALYLGKGDWAQATRKKVR